MSIVVVCRAIVVGIVVCDRTHVHMVSGRTLELVQANSRHQRAVRSTAVSDAQDPFELE